MNPQLKIKIDNEVQKFEDAIKANGGQLLTRYEVAVLRSYIRFKLEEQASEQAAPT